MYQSKYQSQYRNRLLGLMKRVAVFVLCTTLTPLALAKEEPKSGVFTVAVMGEAVYIGQSFPVRKRGNFELKGYLKSDGECSGTFMYREHSGRRAKFECTNGLSGSIKIVSKGSVNGKGSAVVDGKEVNFVYGYDLAETNELLNFPGGQKLAVQNDAIVLVEPN